MRATEALDRSVAAARLETIVREAGALALSMFGAPLKSWIKGVSSPVCEADIAVNKLLRKHLCDVDPGIGWLSEESPDDPARLCSRYVWIVDPIDGTRGFIAGSPDWAISAALVEEGRPIVAAYSLRRGRSSSWPLLDMAPRSMGRQSRPRRQPT